MKKSLKKLLFILLALLSVFLIVSCGDKPSKKEVIEKFVENSKNMKSADVTVNMKMEQKNSASPAGIFMEATGDLSLILEPNLAMKMNLVLPFNNNKLTMYLKDDYSYVQNPADNQWIKQSNKGFSEQFKKAYAQSNAIYDFLIKNIEKQKQDYIITCLATEKYDWSDINLKCVDFDNFPNPNNTFTLKVSPSKDSVKIFNIETGKLIRLSEAKIQKLKEISKGDRE